MKRLAGWLALLAVLALGAWLALGGRETRGRAAPAGDDAPGAAPEPSSTLVEVTPPAEVPAEPEAASSAREAVPTPYDEELARAYWVEGRVLFPAGTPLDERAVVLALGKKFEHGERHRAAVAADGRFRVAFSEKSKSGQLALEARYLYLKEVGHWRASDAAAPITLAPRLGGRIEGKLVLPAGTQAESGGKVQLRSLVKEGDGLSSSHETLGEVGADLGFAFGALVPEPSYTVLYDGATLVGASAQFSVEPGRTHTLELELRAGVVLAGHARDDAGQALSGVEISAHVEEHSGRSILYWRSTQSADDGSFRLAALSAGEIELQAYLKGFTGVQRRLGKLAEGVRQEDLELVLARGNSVAGRVQWPDGTPAKAFVSAVDEKGERQGIFSATDDHETAADGSFRISGLGEGPFRIGAHGQHAEEVTVKGVLTGHEHRKKQYETWRDEQEHVVAGTSELVLTLTRGLIVSGRVIDESGASVNDFTVHAVHGGRRMSWFGDANELSRSFEDAGGAFTLEGFLPGSWELTASAEGYAGTKPVTIDVPSSTPLALVVSHVAAVRGRVLDPHGAPVAGALLSAEQKQDASGLDDGRHKSDERGAFALDHLFPGSVTLTARASGCASSKPLVLELTPGQVQDGIVLNLRTGGTIAGEVLGALARPEVGQQVEIQDLGDANDWRHAETDAQGRFELGDVPAGAYRVSSNTSNGLRLSAEITLGEGETAHVRLAPPDTPVKLHGHVTIGGRAPGRAGVLAQAESDATQSHAECDAEGAYELVVPGAGTYRVFLFGYENEFFWNTTVDVPAVPEFAFDIAVPVGRVRGRVTSRDGAPLAGVLVQSPRESARNGIAAARTYTDSDGRYELLAPAGPLTVSAGGKDDESAASWAESRVTGLVLAPDQTLDGVDFVLSTGGTLAGRVRRADGVPVGHVSLFSLDGGQKTQLGLSEEDGTFRIQGLERGTLLVGASENHGATLRAVSVAIVPGETTELELVPATSVHVLVHDASGTPAACDITLLDEGGHTCPVNRTRKDGEAWLGPLPAGRYTLRAIRDAKQAERAVEIRGDEGKLDLELTLP